jgi:hypothetical protein
LQSAVVPYARFYSAGLDAQRALQVMRDVRVLCRRLGIGVIATLHQPSAPLSDR